MSTARYDNAGKTGTGTVVDNMGSRVKAWANFNGAGAPITLFSAFGVSSVGDGGLGVYAVNHTTTLYVGVTTAQSNQAATQVTTTTGTASSIAVYQWTGSAFTPNDGWMQVQIAGNIL